VPSNKVQHGKVDTSEIGLNLVESGSVSEKRN